MSFRLDLRRGAVVLVSLDPVVGSEQGKIRPAVVVSSNAANSAAAAHHRGVVTVVPITSNIDRVWPMHVLLRSRESGLPADSKAQAEQVRAVDVTRIVRTLGVLPPATVAALDEALRLHLDL